MTPTQKKTPVKLPPRPNAKIAAPIAVKVETYGRAQNSKANHIRIELEDGTTLTADGGHAADIYIYLMDCERYCATHLGTVAPYLGPMLYRKDPNGREVNVGTAK